MRENLITISSCDPSVLRNNKAKNRLDEEAEDISAETTNRTVSLNYFLETGPPFQYVLWDKLIRSYIRPIVFLGNIEKAFLTIRIKENENALRFHWIKNCDPSIVEVIDLLD